MIESAWSPLKDNSDPQKSTEGGKNPSFKILTSRHQVTRIQHPTIIKNRNRATAAVI